MTAKAYLSQVRYIDTRIQSKRDQIAKMRAMLIKGTSSYGNAPKSSKHTDWTDTASEIMSAEQNLMHDIARCVNTRLAISKAIDSMDDAGHRCLLECRYLSGWSWKRIARHMNYSLDYIWHLHSKALKAFKVPEE